VKSVEEKAFFSIEAVKQLVENWDLNDAHSYRITKFHRTAARFSHQASLQRLTDTQLCYQSDLVTSTYLEMSFNDSQEFFLSTMPKQSSTSLIDVKINWTQRFFCSFHR
jgi:hypothetical protein